VGPRTQIREIVVKTMMAVEPNMNTSSKMHVPHRNICYEVFGFDIVLDANLRTWLLEVNTGPALQSPAPLDKRIKVRDGPRAPLHTRGTRWCQPSSAVCTSA
jgi:hypothetical protein